MRKIEKGNNGKMEKKCKTEKLHNGQDEDKDIKNLTKLGKRANPLLGTQLSSAPWQTLM